ncbi:MAG: hypothetical protein ACC669_06120 [bacterium]
MNYRLILTIFAAVLLLAAGPAFAAQPLGLNSFQADTPAIADSVNDNFTTLEKAVPVMWANIDNDPNAVVFSVPTGGSEINSLNNISIPDPGILLISGNAFVNSDTNAPTNFKLVPLVNGVPPDGHTFLASFGSGVQGAVTAEAFTLSYTYAVAVAATVLDVSQGIEPDIPVRWTYNKNNLTVIFFPDIGGAPITNPGIPAGADTTTLEEGL